MDQARVKPPKAAQKSTTRHAGWRQLTNSRNPNMAKLNSAPLRIHVCQMGRNNAASKMPTTAALMPNKARRIGTRQPKSLQKGMSAQIDKNEEKKKID